MTGARSANLPRVYAAALTIACGACGARESSERARDAGATAPIATAAVLGGDSVARVGAVGIPKSLVRAVASAQHLDARAATATLIDEAVLGEAAVGALASSPEVDRRHVAARLDAVLARKVLADLNGAAKAVGAPTTDEYAAVMGDDWVDLEHGESRRSNHALIKKEVADYADRCAQLQKALAGSKSDDDFTARAKAFELPDGQHPIVESLPFCVADGRVVSREGQSFDLAYVKALFALGAVGDQSGPTTSSFGCHIVRLSEIHAPVHASAEVMAERLDARVMRTRGLPEYQKLLERLHGAAHVEPVADESLLVAPHFVVKLAAIAASDPTPASAP